jgi:hypothetical protein
MGKSMPKDWVGHKQIDRIIVYHEAYKAGPHVEAYLVIDGTAYNVGVKRLRPEHIDNITKNNGKLTIKSRDYLIDVMADEFKKGAFLAQTTDHTPAEARMSWTNHKFNKGYGAGEMREVLLDSKVDLFHCGDTIEYRDWDLNPDSNAYVASVFAPTEDRPGRILKVGFKKHESPKFADRLHLKPHIGESTFERFKKHIGENGTVTVKLDGASCYFESTKDGTSYFSPRHSKVTGERINYNGKVKGLVNVKSEQRTTGMGELNYIDTNTGRVLTAHETGGILNRNAPVPEHIKPVLTVYRIDKIGNKHVGSEPYASHVHDRIRPWCDRIGNSGIQAPQEVSWDNAKQASEHNEGLVGVPEGKSILEGHKYKPRGDYYDWKVVDVHLAPGPKGRIAGTVEFANEKEKRFHIGASSLGMDSTVHDVMLRPKEYMGRVAKVECYKGHEGRAAKFVEWHLDK